LKAQLDDLAAENLGLKAKTDELADEVARLKFESTKAQELARTRRNLRSMLCVVSPRPCLA
jgi:hypothetical protein